MTKYVGVLTAGGDSPGLNAAIRGLTKGAVGAFGMEVIGFRDGFRGLVENRTVALDRKMCSGILTAGGTILGTSRDKPQNMMVGSKQLDMTDVIVDNYRKHKLDALICMGGRGTQKNAYQLAQRGLNIITLPKTIDNDIMVTDTTIGFDTALSISTEAIDRLHSTAESHHRVILVEIMGHNVGWLALGAGLAGGADIILIPEIPYSVEKIAEALQWRRRDGRTFSIIAVAEGAKSKESAKAEDKLKGKNGKKNGGKEDASRIQNTLELSDKLQELSGVESRVTILGHLQRGGTPSASDRLLATQLGTACAELINRGTFGVMLAVQGKGCKAVPLKDVVTDRKTVPLDHPWIQSAKHVGTSLGV